MDFVPSPQQAEAIVKAKDWYWNRAEDQQIFRLFGFAGTGKTTITTHIMDELGLYPTDKNGGGGGVVYGAFTGKAALVMRRKGTPASTIHSLIYRVVEADRETVDACMQKLSLLRTTMKDLKGTELTLARQEEKRLTLVLADLRQPNFILNEESVVRDAALIVLDEVSMVGEEMANDLLAFGRPILVLGDPGQLPPIKGEGAFTEKAPDVMLTEIHRQAEESAIIRLATMARLGEEIPYGEYDEGLVRKERRFEAVAEIYLGGDQVICGRNMTRSSLNNRMKRALGFPEPYPTGKGEKIICLKNQHARKLINGMFLELTDIDFETASPLAFKADAKTEEGEKVKGENWFYKGHYDNHVRYDAERLQRDWKSAKGLVETVWGYAITCHKAQGSQWDNVVVVDEEFGRTQEDRARWLYTAITRAERKLTILK